MTLSRYLDPGGAPRERPRLEDMHPETVAIHRGIDRTIRASGVAHLHPEGETLQVDLLGSRAVRDWQEKKAEMTFTAEACWSELPSVYGRYGTEATRNLLRKIRSLESARAAVVTDCGMQACALLFDILLVPGSHAITMRQIYNKTRRYLEWTLDRTGGKLSVVDDGDVKGLARAFRPETRVVFAETFTNPLTRAVDPPVLASAIIRRRKEVGSLARLVIDNTIASPWGLARPLLEFEGVDFVVASGTKALGGEDRDMWGYVASNAVDVLNEVMDLQAMRGGILDWRRASAVMTGFGPARERFERRCRTAVDVAEFLAAHPNVEQVFHPSRPDHPDRDTIKRHYKLPGSLMSFRVRGLDEETTRHFCDVVATTIVPRYALSFDGLATKVNHHRTVSEYFTPEEELVESGIDRIVRLGVGLEAPEDLMACINWSLWNHEHVSREELEAWRTTRARDLGI